MRRIGEPDEVQVLRAAIRARVADVRTAVPGMVVDYDAAKQTATVKLAVRLPTPDGSDVEEIKPLPNVPVKWPRGGGYFATMPLVAGDPGLLVFSEVDFSAWRETGEVADPATPRRHGLYAYFLPGGCADGDEIPEASADHMVLGKTGGAIARFKDSTIELGGGATQFAALANKVQAEINALRSWAASHTHPYTDTPVGPAVTLAAASPPPEVGSVAATKVKVE